jgi:hypothetical protein
MIVENFFPLAQCSLATLAAEFIQIQQKCSWSIDAILNNPYQWQKLRGMFFPS